MIPSQKMLGRNELIKQRNVQTLLMKKQLSLTTFSPLFYQNLPSYNEMRGPFHSLLSTLDTCSQALCRLCQDGVLLQGISRMETVPLYVVACFFYHGLAV